MKKIIIPLLLSILAFSCNNDDDNFVAPIEHTFNIKFSEDYNNANAPNVNISITSGEDGKTYSATTDTNGNATLSVVPGNYKVTASLTYTAEAYTAAWGQETNGDVSFNASEDNISITANSSTTTNLVLVTGRIGNLIIKQVYFSGSDTKLGAVFRDQFFEVHNNSNETLYLDGIYFAQVWGTTSIPSTLKSYHLPNGQYDWSQSLYQAYAENANTHYVYSDEVIQFPGSGEDYPLVPGESAIVAATAINHKAPLTITDDEGETVVYEVLNPDLTIDLSQAPFEAYFRPYQESIGSAYLDYDIDNPNSVNMTVVFKNGGGRDLIFDPLGRDAFVIFEADNDTFNSWNSVPLPSITSDNYTETTKRFLQIPITYILDGMEAQHTDTSNAKPKRLPDSIDAGEAATISGKYSSESVIRLKKPNTNGNVFYQDTNNSFNDFEVAGPPVVEIE
ncbi:MAG: DUF4876 domain-containing protein [Aestuariibaculum sp.]